MAYLLSNICTKNYWNPKTIVEIIVGGPVVSFFETQCRCACKLHSQLILSTGLHFIMLILVA